MLFGVLNAAIGMAATAGAAYVAWTGGSLFKKT